MPKMSYEELQENIEIQSQINDALKNTIAQLKATTVNLELEIDSLGQENSELRQELSERKSVMNRVRNLLTQLNNANKIKADRRLSAERRRMAAVEAACLAETMTQVFHAMDERTKNVMVEKYGNVVKLVHESRQMALELLRADQQSVFWLDGKTSVC